MIKGNSSGNRYREKFNDNGNCITDCKAIANGFNNFFTNVGPSLASKITAPNDNQCIFNTMGRLYLKFGISVGRYGKSPKYRLKIAQNHPNIT